VVCRLWLLPSGEYADIYTIDVDGSGLANLTHSTPDPSITLMPGKNIFQMSYTPKWTYDNQIVFWSNQNSGSYTFFTFPKTSRTFCARH
jgi:hypothetical protein